MWYVVQVSAGREEAARELIDLTVDKDVLEECFVPRYEVKRRINGEWTTCQATLFSGYLIVVTDHVEQMRAELQKVPAFTKLLGNDDVFIPLNESEIALIEALTQQGQRTIELSEYVFEDGQIIISAGPLLGHEGLISRINRKKRIAYLQVEMFGRTVETQVGLELVRRKPKR